MSTWQAIQCARKKMPRENFHSAGGERRRASWRSMRPSANHAKEVRQRPEESNRAEHLEVGDGRLLH